MTDGWHLELFIHSVEITMAKAIWYTSFTVYVWSKITDRPEILLRILVSLLTSINYALISTG